MSMNKIRDRLSAIKLETDDVNEEVRNLQKEIGDETQRADDAEQMVKELNSRLQVLDDKKTDTEEELKEMKARIAEIETDSDENSRFNRVLESRGSKNDDKLTELLRVVTQQTEDIDKLDKQNKELQERTRDVENALEDAEEKEQQLKSIVEEHTEELYQLRNSVTSLHASDTKMTMSEKQHLGKITDLSEELKETNMRAERAEDNVKALSNQVAAMEDELDTWNEKVRSAQGELEQIYSEINEI